jgi:hypothetical protein
LWPSPIKHLAHRHSSHSAPPCGSEPARDSDTPVNLSATDSPPREQITAIRSLHALPPIAQLRAPSTNQRFKAPSVQATSPISLGTNFCKRSWLKRISYNKKPKYAQMHFSA